MRHLGDPLARYRQPVNTWNSVLLEKALAERKAGAEQLQLEGTASVDTVIVSSVGVKGSLLRVCVEIEGLPVEAVVDTGVQCTVISREHLRNLNW